MSELIKIEKQTGANLAGADNFSFADKTYTIHSGEAENIGKHIKNVVGFAKHFDRDITLIDADNNIKLSVCPTCNVKDLMAKYTKQLKPDGAGRNAMVASQKTERNII